MIVQNWQQAYRTIEQLYGKKLNPKYVKVEKYCLQVVDSIRPPVLVQHSRSPLNLESHHPVANSKYAENVHRLYLQRYNPEEMLYC